jgi:hypothetical protein
LRTLKVQNNVVLTPNFFETADSMALLLLVAAAQAAVPPCKRCALPIADVSDASIARLTLDASLAALRSACAESAYELDGCAELSRLSVLRVAKASLTQLRSGAHYRVEARTSMGDLAISFARHAAPVCSLVVEGAVLSSRARAGSAADRAAHPP